MKETDFIKQNKGKWEELEHELTRSEIRPDKVTNLYIDTVDDLSFARTHYPNRLVRSYLNGVTKILSLQVQRSQKAYWKSMKLFWKQELPLVMFEARKEFLIAFLILACSVAIGIFSSMHDSSFAEYILGAGYVEETIENIEKGDPLAIYKDAGKSDMFFAITINNILVSVRTFLLSLFFGFGTVLILIYNGIMLGVFQYFFIERGLFFESFLTIWQHGVIEISSIVLAGTAGLVLAKGVIFPGSYSRLDAFRIAGRKSLIIMLGLMPLLVYSGAIEAFVTRYTDVHWTIRLTTILLSVGFVIIYFVIYPRILSKKITVDTSFSVVTRPIVTSKFSFKTIRGNVAVLWESIRVLGLLRPWLVPISLGVSAIVVLGWWFFGVDANGEAIEPLWVVGQPFWFLDTDFEVMLISSNFFVILSSILCSHWAVFKVLRANKETIGSFSFSMFKSVAVSFVLAILLTASFINAGFATILLFLFPMFGLYAVSIFHASAKNGTAWRIANMLLAKSYGKLLLLLLLFSLTIFMSSLFIQVIIEQLVLGGITNFIFPELPHVFSAYLIPGFFRNILTFAILALVNISFHLSFFSLMEMQSAKMLNAKVEAAFPVDSIDNVASPSLLRKEVFN